MSQEKRENVFSAIISGEAEGKSGNEMARYITEKMRTIYGGYWSMYGSQEDDYQSINYEKGNYAKVRYNSKMYHVYKNSCGSSIFAIERPSDIDGTKYESSVSFDSSTTMESKLKDDMISAFKVAEAAIKNKPNFIGEKMQEKYGGSWSVHFSFSLASDFQPTFIHASSVPGHFAKFSSMYGNLKHEFVVFKQLC